MSGSAAPGRPGSPAAAAAVGIGAGFVAAVFAARLVGPALLQDAEPSWAPARLALALGLAAISGAAGAGAGSLFLLWSRIRADPAPLPLPRAALVALWVAAVGLGAWGRFASLEDLPYPTWHDDLLLAPKALALEASPRDFRDSIRPVIDGKGKAVGTVGVLYVEAYRLALRAFGTNVFGVRFLSALGGVLSMLSAAALARALLPRGGAALTVLVLAGLRWHLILSRWSWNMILLAPILDVAALCALAARRRGSVGAAAAAGVAVGVGAHVYLSAWIGLAAVLLLLVWPGGGSLGRRAGLASFAFAGLLAAAAPLFLLREGRAAPYFARSSKHNVLVEMRQSRSALPFFGSAAEALVAPWLLPDPEPRHDLPGRRRLPLVVGLGLAAALTRALVRPSADLSAFLLAHAAAAFAASVAWGEQLSPNGSRFGYLTGVAAIGAAAGLLGLVGLVPSARRGAAALAAVGLVAIGGAMAAGDLMKWGRLRPTFDSFIGSETLVGRAAMRWERYGQVRLDFTGLYSPLVVDTIRRLRVAPRAEAAGPGALAPPQPRLFRFLAPGASPPAGERIVERVRDAWGREWTVITGRKAEGVRR